jgi:sigma-E factor negative regulatory protein RseA
MSEQIREQVSAFLDGELPGSEMELLLKRLTRDAELRESFGRYSLIGEALRGSHRSVISRGFATRVNQAIDGETAPVDQPSTQLNVPKWWKPFAGVAVVAGVAAVAVVALQQRAISPAARAPLSAAISTIATAPGNATSAPAHQIDTPAATVAAYEPGQTREALSYTVPPAINPDAPAVMPAGRLTNYVFAHSRYSYGLGQRGMLADLLIEDEDAPVVPESSRPAAATAHAP